MEGTKKCKACGRELIGRADKKYCGSQCRSIGNNREKSIREKIILSTNKQLRKNRSILRTLCPLGKAVVRKEVLIQMGFDFNCFSSLFPSPQLLYYLVYDYGFAAIYEGQGIPKVMIIQKQDYMNSFNPWNYVKQKPDK